MVSVGVIGVGYVGLPLALLCAKKGFDVVGFGRTKENVEKLRNGICTIKDERCIEQFKNFGKKINFSNNSEDLANCDLFVICVPTPIKSNYDPDLDCVTSAINKILPFTENKLIILESTVYPGTVDETVLPILNHTNKKYYFAYCPERINPGDKKWNVENIRRVLGGINDESCRRAIKFYTQLGIIIKKVSNIKTAEASKITENTFRDVNIAFVNEIAKSFDKMGIDTKEVIEAAATKPFGFLPHYPGCGVGGHCIAVDPYYLISKAKSLGFDHKFLKLAREINESMPDYTVDLITSYLNKIKKSVHGSAIGLLGVSYKKNIGDIRESPFFKIKKKLENLGGELYIFDPYVKYYSNVNSVEELLTKSECIILITDHDEFTNITASTLKKNNINIVIDGRNCLDKELIEQAGILYKGIGR